MLAGGVNPNSEPLRGSHRPGRIRRIGRGSWESEEGRGKMIHPWDTIR